MITADREIVTARVFDAERELVWEAWTHAEHVGQWWGPNGFRTTTHEMDVRPGGVWRFVMHGPDGVDYPNEIVYREVLKPERLVYLHGPVPQFEVTVTFEEREGKTELTMRAVFKTAAERDRVVQESGAIEGAKQTLARLAEFLTRGEFVFTRELDAPRDLVWKAFTETERLMQWWGPKGFTMLAAKVDLRPGGVFLYSMRAPNGQVMWGKWVFREIVAPERLATVVSFTDEEGNPLRHPMSPTWPLEVLNTMTLVERDGKTTITIYGTPINAAEEERKTFKDGRASMKQGFTGTLDQLAEYLAKVERA
jgi:uncharacterized protein YndB with AHSA1/START domain